jgi:hypothetical protein
MARELQVTFDAADPAGLARFWAAALGFVLQPPPGSAPPPDADVLALWGEFLDSVGVPEERRNDSCALIDPDGDGPRVFFQRVPEGTRSVVTTPSGLVELVSVKNKVHLDVRAAPGLEGDERMAALEIECERLVALGATRAERHEPAPPMSGGHIVMLDPEGNEFCLD